MTVAALGTLTLAGCSGSGEEVGLDESATAEGAEVKILQIQPGSAEDLKVLEDSSPYAGKEPYYLHFRVTKAENGKISGPDLRVYSDGQELQPLSVLPDVEGIAPSVGPDGELLPGQEPRKFEQCEDGRSADFDTAAKGQSYESCSIFLADEGSETPSKIEWQKTGEEDPLVTWE